MNQFYTYIAYFKDNKLYNISVTTHLKRRLKLLNQLKEKHSQNFGIKLVYFEEYSDSATATKRETFLQNPNTELIEKLVSENNPMLINLINEI